MARIHTGGGKVGGLGSGAYGRGGSAVRIDVKTAQAHSFMARFQRETRAVKEYISLIVAERVKKNAEERVESRSKHPPRMGKGGGPRHPSNILRPSAGGQAIRIVSDKEFRIRNKGGATSTGFTVYISSGQAHLLEYGVSPHWQRMKRVKHTRWVELGEAFKNGEITKNSPWEHGLFRHPGHPAKPFVMPAVKAARGWANRQGKHMFMKKFNAAKMMAGK